MGGCHTPLLIGIAAQGALDAVFNTKDRVLDVRALKARVPLCKIGSYLAVSVGEWQQTRAQQSIVKSALAGNGDILKFLTQAVQRANSAEMCFDQLDDENWSRNTYT